MRTRRTGDPHKRQKTRHTEVNSDVNSSQVLQHSNSGLPVRVTTQVMQLGALLPAMTSSSRDTETPKARSMPFDEQLGIKIDYLARHQQRQLHYINHPLPDQALLKGWKHITMPRAYPEIDVLLILPNGTSQWEQELGVAKPARLLLHGKLDGSSCMDGDATLPSFTLTYLTAGATAAPDLYALIGNKGDVFVPLPRATSAQRILAIEDAIKLGIHQLRQGENADITLPRHPCPWTYGGSGFQLMASPAKSRTRFTVHPEDLAQLSTEHTASMRAPRSDDEDVVIVPPHGDGIVMNREASSIIYID
ncbi:hypothetical protein RI367_002649 [Sorochytrium milnesiophthora]